MPSGPFESTIFGRDFVEDVVPMRGGRAPDDHSIGLNYVEGSNALDRRADILAIPRRPGDCLEDLGDPDHPLAALASGDGHALLKTFSRPQMGASNQRSEYADGGICQCGFQLAQRGEKNDMPTGWPHLLEGLGCIAHPLAGELGHARLMRWIECSRQSA